MYSKFDYLIAVLEERDQNNFLIGTDTLREIMVGNLDDGIFYEDSKNLLETSNNSLNDENIYKLNVDVPEKLKF